MGFFGPGETAYTVVCLTTADGTVSDADDLPIGTLYLNGVENDEVVTVTDIGAGRYRVSWENPGALGNVVSIVLDFEMDTIPSHATVWEGRLAATPPTAAEIVAALVAAAPLAALAAANWTTTHWRRLRAAAMGTKTKNAAGTNATLKDVDGTVVDTDSA